MIRPATAADAQAISEVHVRSWQVAYRGIFPDDFLDGLSDSMPDRVSWRDAMLRNPAPRSSTLVAESAGRIVGFADASPTRDQDLDPKTVGEVLAIYVRPSEWGHGYGRRLLEAAESALAEVGCSRAMLWVLTENRRARGFYEKAGWTHDGSSKTDQFGGNAVEEVRYSKSLA